MCEMDERIATENVRCSSFIPQENNPEKLQKLQAPPPPLPQPLYVWGLKSAFGD